MNLLVQQIWYQLKLFARRPVAAFFVIIMPLVLLFVFTEMLGDVSVDGVPYSLAQFYAPSLAVFGAVSACYTYLANSTALARDSGVLKRMRGTPLPPLVYVTARIIAACVIALMAVGLLMGAGIGLYGVEVFPSRLPMAVLALVAGSLSFAALGMMVTALSRSGDTVQAVTNATLLPLAFLSEVFIRPQTGMPRWMEVVGDIFPLKHFAIAFRGAFEPGLEGTGFAFGGGPGVYAVLDHVVVMAVWGVAAAVVAARYFVWSPGGER